MHRERLSSRIRFYPRSEDSYEFKLLHASSPWISIISRQHPMILTTKRTTKKLASMSREEPFTFLMKIRKTIGIKCLITLTKLLSIQGKCQVILTFHSHILLNLNHFLMSRDTTFDERSGVGSVENLSSAHDEVLHLKKQVSKLNRRLLNVEIDNLQRVQREKVVCVLGIAYFVVKMLMWLNKN